jgi:hypothetical protein
VQHGSPRPVSTRPFVSKNLMARRTVKGRPNMASDEAILTTGQRKQGVPSNDRGHSRLPQLEASLTRVIASLSGDSHSVVSNALRTYDRLVVKESHNIQANQEKIEEAQCQIKKSQLNITRAQNSLVDDITTVVKISNADEVRAGTSPCDIHVAKRRAEVSPDIFMSAIPLFQSFNFCVSYSIFYQLFYVSDIFICQPFFLSQPFFMCQSFYYVSLICISHFILYPAI